MSGFIVVAGIAGAVLLAVAFYAFGRAVWALRWWLVLLVGVLAAIALLWFLREMILSLELPAAPAITLPSLPSIALPDFNLSEQWLSTLVTWMLVLGLILAALAWMAGHTGWAGGFATLAILAVALYNLWVHTCWTQSCEMQQRSEASIKTAKWQAAAVQQQYAATPAVLQQCPGLKEPYQFEATKPHAPVNKVGRCSSDFWHAGHCIKVQVAGSAKELGPFCHTGGKTYELPPDIEYAWSAGNPFEGAYRLGPPRYVKFLSVR